MTLESQSPYTLSWSNWGNAYTYEQSTMKARALEEYVDLITVRLSSI